jgi:hypothetical protein
LVSDAPPASGHRGKLVRQSAVHSQTGPSNLAAQLQAEGTQAVAEERQPTAGFGPGQDAMASGASKGASGTNSGASLPGRKASGPGRRASRLVAIPASKATVVAPPPAPVVPPPALDLMMPVEPPAPAPAVPVPWLPAWPVVEALVCPPPCWAASAAWLSEVLLPHPEMPRRTTAKKPEDTVVRCMVTSVDARHTAIPVPGRYPGRIHDFPEVPRTEPDGTPTSVTERSRKPTDYR